MIYSQREMSSPKNSFFSKRVKNLKLLGYFLQLAPFVRAVILSGSMTTGSAKESSDIDLLVVTAPDRLYTGRFFVTFWAMLSGKKRKVFDKNPAGKFCLNYYLSTDNLDIKPHTARCANFHRYVINIWDQDGVFERLLRENFWMRKFKVKIGDQQDVTYVKSNFPLECLIFFSIFRFPLEYILSGKFGDFVEEKLSSWQRKKITGRKLYQRNKLQIVVSENELRLHPKK